VLLFFLKNSYFTHKGASITDRCRKPPQNNLNPALGWVKPKLHYANFPETSKWRHHHGTCHANVLGKLTTCRRGAPWKEDVTEKFWKNIPWKAQLRHSNRIWEQAVSPIQHKTNRLWYIMHLSWGEMMNLHTDLGFLVSRCLEDAKNFMTKHRGSSR